MPRRPLPQPRRLRPQPLVGPGRQHPRHQARHAHRRGRGRHPFDRRRLFDDHVRVRPADPERRHGGPTRPAGLGPRSTLGQQFDVSGRPVHVRRRRVDVQRLGQYAVPHRHDHLDQAGHPGRGLRVSDVGLDRAQPQRPIRGPVLSVRGQQRLCLDRVAQRRPGPVRLHRVHVRRRQPGTGQRRPDHPLLGRSVRRGQPVRRAVLVDRRAAQERQHGMPVAPRVGQPFHHQQSDALAPSRTVRARRERPAPAVRRQAALSGELDEDVRGGHHRHPTGQGQIALARPQRVRRQVQCHQGRRAGGVHADRRPLQAQRVGHPAGHHAAHVPGQEHALEPVGSAMQPRGVVVVHHPGEDTRVAPAQCPRIQARVLERLPRGLQKQPLLRVHGRRLTRRDAEELGVELARLVEESAPPGVDLADLVRVGVVQVRQVPATIPGEVADRVRAGRDQSPQVLGTGHAARIPAADADDRDRLVDRRGRSGCGRDRLARRGADHLARHPSDQGRSAGVVEDRGRGQPQAGERVDPVAQFEGGQRVDAQFAEGAVEVESFGCVVSEDGGELPAHQVGDRPFALLGREFPDPPVPRRRVRPVAGGGGTRRRDSNEAAQYGGQRAARGQGPQRVAVQAGRDRVRPVPVQRGVEQGESGLGGQRRDPAPGHPGPVGVVEVAGHPAALGPQPPGQRVGGQPGGAAVFGEGVQEGIGRRVRALPGIARDRGDGREQHERRGVRRSGQLVQMPGRVHLGAQHRVEPIRGQRLQRRVVEHTGGVYDDRRRVLGGDVLDHPAQRGPVGDIARGHGHPGAERGEFGDRLLGPGRLPTRTSEQEQVPDAVFGDQSAGDQRPQGAGATGDQRGPVRIGSASGSRRLDRVRRVDPLGGNHAG
ncbi:hypothetical protein EHYA_05611 [Embleya hyalina]|uniref:Uncharacterized protein n=1 Tax=Embleya hyalina TaxID=516124 RepID=A0A401YTH2_9ACTN|nr:hypothetical protein EHYA_05611 [Embleya hyalina]